MKNQLNEFFNRMQSASGKPLNEAKDEKPSAGLSKEKKSEIVKKAKRGEDIGKKGKGFEKIAKKAAKKYGSEEKGRAVAAASMWKNIKREGADLNESTDALTALAQVLAGAAPATWAGFSWAKSLLAMPEFIDKWKATKSKDDKIALLSTYLTYVLDPRNLGSYTKKDKLDSINENEDHEVSMAKNSLESIIASAQSLMNKLGNEERNIPGWIQDHITNAENYIDQAAQGFHELHGDDDQSEELYEEEETYDPGFEKFRKRIEKGNLFFADPNTDRTVKITSFEQFLEMLDRYAKAELIFKAATRKNNANENTI